VRDDFVLQLLRDAVQATDEPFRALDQLTARFKPRIDLIRAASELGGEDPRVLR
jgi:hypothetical protein